MSDAAPSGTRFAGGGHSTCIRTVGMSTCLVAVLVTMVALVTMVTAVATVMCVTGASGMFALARNGLWSDDVGDGGVAAAVVVGA
jgi:hypothetical protein